MRDNNGRFQKGVSGNPAGRPKKDTGRLSFRLSLGNNPNPKDLSEAATRLAVEAAAGKRPLAETKAMISILQQAISACHDAESHEMVIRNAIMQGINYMSAHIREQGEWSKDHVSAFELEQMMRRAQAEVDAYERRQKA